MKKIFSNIRTMAALLMAGAAFAACSNSDDIISEQPANTDKQGYTLTISASKDGSTTRALSLEGTAVVASWETTDEIVVSKNGTQIGTLSPTNINGLEATFSGTISGDADINVSDALTLSYHPIASIEGFASQDGTLNGLATSAENFDMAIATVTISEISGKNITVSESQANFVNQTAVVVLSPYNSSWSEYHSLNSLTVSVTMDIPEVGTVTEKIGPITVSGDQPHYFSLPSQSLLAEALAAKYSLSASAVSTLLASATVTFTGHQTGDDYDREYLTCSKTGYKFAAGKYYKLDNSNFSMTMLYKRAVADKDVYVESQDVSWSHTVTFAVNKEIGWKVVGDYVFCGDKQLYVVDNSGPEPSEGWVKASDDHIPFGATYSLRDPEPAATTVTWDFSALSGTAETGYENGGVKLEACDGQISFDYNQLDAWGAGITITNTLGKKFTSIVINGEPYSIGIGGEGWSNADDNSSATWTGNSESVHIAEASSASGITSIVFTLEDAPAPAPSTVTWDNTNVFIYDNRLVNIGNQGLNSGTYEGITVTYDGALCSSQFSFYDSDYGPVIDIYGNKGDSYTFTAPIGKKFTKIEINNNRTYEFTEHGDWTRESNNLVWEGTPSNAVTLGGSGTGETYCFVTSIVFTLQ